MKAGDWVICPAGRGYEEDGKGSPSNRLRHFPRGSIGQLIACGSELARIWLVGEGKYWHVPAAEIKQVDVVRTGDKFPHKICNICHCLLPVEEFDRNQRNKHGEIRRPSCKRCRNDIDRRAPATAQAKRAKKNRPAKGSLFQCPICGKRSIVGVTARVVADHDHHTGDIRGFICDSCNTGLGRFKNGHDCLRDALVYIEEREKRRPYSKGGPEKS